MYPWEKCHRLLITIFHTSTFETEVLILLPCKCNFKIFYYFISHLNQGASALPRGHQNDFSKQKNKPLIYHFDWLIKIIHIFSPSWKNCIYEVVQFLKCVCVCVFISKNVINLSACYNEYTCFSYTNNIRQK